MVESTKETYVVKGIAASQGIAIGKAFLLEEEELHVIPKKIPKDQIRKEIARYNSARTQVRNEMMLTREKILKTLGKEHTPLCDAYLLMLEDPLLKKDIMRRINEESVNAEYALWATLEKMIESFEKIEDEYFRERKNDIQYIGKRIILRLIGRQKKPISEIEADSIIIAHNLSPAETISLKEHKGKGFGIDIGGRTSHIALFAQGLEIPGVVGLRNVTYLVDNGDTIVIDGNQGIVIVNPDKQILENYQREYEIELRERQELEKLRDLPAQTIDEYKVVLTCNIDTPEELKSVLSSGAEGIGLLRTEFMYLNRSSLPTEEELYETYRDIIRKMLPYSVTIRTLDLGGDKLVQFGLDGVTSEDNPILGLRAIRLCLKRPEIFRPHLRAILRASATGKVKIMFPMISGVGEFIQARKFVEEVKSELRKENKPFDETVKIGAMIEVPSAAVTSDLIAREADFLSIGTNDLIQYTLAVDRTNETVAFMYEPLHLSVLRLLKHIVDAGRRTGKLVSMCGEMAGDIDFTKILIGMELNEFSMPAVMIPKIKKIVRSTSLQEAKDMAKEVLNADSREILLTALKRS